MKKQIAWVALAHASISAIFWLWAGVIALGLGFKDKGAWTALDHIQVTIVPTIALIVTVPGRYFIFEGWLGLLTPWLLNSFAWSVFLVIVYKLFKPKHE